jgi:hypothetical protein
MLKETQVFFDQIKKKIIMWLFVLYMMFKMGIITPHKFICSRIANVTSYAMGDDSQILIERPFKHSSTPTCWYKCTKM